MERINVSISKELYEEILRIVKSDIYKFDSVEDCIDKVLRDALKNYILKPINYNTTDITNEDIKGEDEELKDRLKRLGYI